MTFGSVIRLPKIRYFLNKMLPKKNDEHIVYDATLNDEHA